MPKNLLEKSDSDLDRLRNAGLGMMYLGIETGYDVRLRKPLKEPQAKGSFKHVRRPKPMSLSLSCMVILGIGGSKYTKQHIDDTAKLVSVVSSDSGGFELEIRGRNIR